MGTYDHYEPIPQLKCLHCGALLLNWQGDAGPNKFLLWRQHIAEADDQLLVEANVHLPVGERAKYRLPSEFVISTLCSCGIGQEADCVSEKGCWITTQLVTPETFSRRKNEKEEEFFIRRRTLLNQFSVRTNSFPSHWLDQIPATVFGCLVPGEIRIVILVADGSTRDIPVETIPADLRMPNTPLWIQCDKEMNIVRAWKRTAEV